MFWRRRRKPAPEPVFDVRVLSITTDDMPRPPGTEAAWRELRAIVAEAVIWQDEAEVLLGYARPAGDSERIKEVDEDVRHADTPLFLTEARQWMNRWLKGDETPLKIEPDSENGKETEARPGKIVRGGQAAGL